MIELYQLEHLLAVAQYGTLSKAAEELHTSQPVLSRTMQKLEDELQVQLFDRQKNKLTFNKNGEVAVQYAEKVLDEALRMVEQVRAFDRCQRTIAIGSCAPAPLDGLFPILSRYWPNMTITTEMRDDLLLLDGIRNGSYTLVVLTEDPLDNNLYCQRYGDERLYLSLPPTHPLSDCRNGVWLKDIDGERMLLHANIGFWRGWVQQMLPSTHFLLQQDFEDFNELVSSSVLPAFSSDVMMRNSHKEGHRVLLPILDSEAHVTYYCVCRQEDQKRLAPLLREIAEQGL
ncbi:LysR family transcriptional regulator [Enterocloster clostridioformis]|uniref:LysR family transcriptional regulator n=1 Tax=Enterocloster clostridioformis TaxID=1531 RepID=UPI00080C3E4A|nr:LysR family transcriptional regulator [Enterocloster clostridioformis]ANU48450.1 LysR family transcriptional regulator [Lachnoclostridium sp. YL32]NDO29292.1 LysR family transcriptional regulator [Enterocloster clostridioformis]OXE68846.1 LysR family transcriptional regulator [Enterocloster clostridioformis]QQR02661.1 LysR family transcriptional regulator [Enterocloster clostridioformis]